MNIYLLIYLIVVIIGMIVLKKSDVDKKGEKFTFLLMWPVIFVLVITGLIIIAPIATLEFIGNKLLK